MVKINYKPKNPELVQLLNPVTKHWVVVDKIHGSIIKHSRTTKPYKHIKREDTIVDMEGD